MVNATVGAVGCLMSSTSMALAGHGIPIPNDANNSSEANPQALNVWLRAHNGYVGDSNLQESAVVGVDPKRVAWPTDAMHRKNDLSMLQVKTMLDAERPVIANVMHGKHFVLVIGYDSTGSTDALFVNDPGFYTTSYSLSEDVVGWRLYTMVQ